MSGKNGKCLCNNLGPAAQVTSLSGNGGAYIVQPSKLFSGIDNQSIAGFDTIKGGYTPGLSGLLDIDIKPFLLLGIAYVAWRYATKKGHI